MARTKITSENDARQAICEMGRLLFTRGYAHATAGNISIRLSEETLITPTDACLGLLDPESLAKIDAQGTQVSGERASKTIALHRAIYEQSSQLGIQTNCIVHTHSTATVLMSMLVEQRAGKELLDPITPYFVMKVGHVPLIAYARPGAPEVINEVTHQMRDYAKAGTPISAVMLTRLGPVVWGSNPLEAMARLEELEETARLAVQHAMLAAPPLKPLEEDQLQALRSEFQARW